MMRLQILVLGVIAVLSGCDSADVQEAGPVADLLLVNADVVTVDEALPRAEAMQGLQAIRYRGDVLGRGVPTTSGLRSEIARARAADLRACLRAATDPGG